jgi:Tfp pilus assembly protein PilZ
LTRPLPWLPNLHIIVTVILPEGDTELVLKGRVVWMRPVFTSCGRFHQGIQFQVINWELEGLAKKESPK